MIKFEFGIGEGNGYEVHKAFVSTLPDPKFYLSVVEL